MWYVKLNYKANYTKQRLSSNKLWYSRQLSILDNLLQTIFDTLDTLDIRHHNETGFIGWDWYPIYSLNALPEVSGYELYWLRRLRCMLRLRYNCVALMAKQTSRIVCYVALLLRNFLICFMSLRPCVYVYLFFIFRKTDWLTYGYPWDILIIVWRYVAIRGKPVWFVGISNGCYWHYWDRSTSSVRCLVYGWYKQFLLPNEKRSPVPVVYIHREEKAIMEIDRRSYKRPSICTGNRDAIIRCIRNAKETTIFYIFYICISGRIR